MAKINVDAKSDVLHIEKQLQQELKKILLQQLFETPIDKERVEKYLEKLLHRVYEDVHENVSVAGFDWFESPEDESEQYEPFDEEAHKQLQELQSKLDARMLTVAKSRREVPAQLSALIEDVQKLRKKQIDQIEFQSDDTLEAIREHHIKEEDMKVLESVICIHNNNTEIMNELKKKLPNVVNKLRRIKQVLEVIPSMDQSQTERTLRQDFGDIYGEKTPHIL